MEVLLVSSGERPGMLLSSDAQGSPTHKELSDQNVDNAKVRLRNHSLGALHNG